jgi:hypothetical protein
VCPSLAHRTVRCATRQCPVHQDRTVPNSPLSGFSEAHSAIIHRTVRCTSGAMTPSRNGRLQKLKNQRYSDEQCAQSESRPSEAHQTLNNACPVRHQTSGATRGQILQRSNAPEPNGWVTWLAHRTVSGGTPDCLVRPSTAATPNGYVVVDGYKYPQPPPLQESKISEYHIHYKSSSIHS